MHCKRANLQDCSRHPGGGGGGGVTLDRAAAGAAWRHPSPRGACMQLPWGSFPDLPRPVAAGNDPGGLHHAAAAAAAAALAAGCRKGAGPVPPAAAIAQAAAAAAARRGEVSGGAAHAAAGRTPAAGAAASPRQTAGSAAGRPGIRPEVRPEMWLRRRHCSGGRLGTGKPHSGNHSTGNPVLTGNRPLLTRGGPNGSRVPIEEYPSLTKDGPNGNLPSSRRAGLAGIQVRTATRPNLAGGSAA